jgi:hypothetical protein
MSLALDRSCVAPARPGAKTLVCRLPPPPPLPHPATAGESCRAKLAWCRRRGALPYPARGGPCGAASSPAAVQIGGGRRGLAWRRPASCIRGGSRSGSGGASGGARRAGGRAAEQRGGGSMGGLMVLLRISGASWRRRRPAAALRWLVARPRSRPLRARSGLAGQGVAQLFGGSGWTRLELEVEEGGCCREKGWSQPCGSPWGWTASRQRRHRGAVAAARQSGEDVLLQRLVGRDEVCETPDENPARA